MDVCASVCVFNVGICEECKANGLAGGGDGGGGYFVCDWREHRRYIAHPIHSIQTLGCPGQHGHARILKYYENQNPAAMIYYYDMFNYTRLNNINIIYI